MMDKMRGGGRRGEAEKKRRKERRKEGREEERKEKTWKEGRRRNARQTVPSLSVDRQGRRRRRRKNKKWGTKQGRWAEQATAAGSSGNSLSSLKRQARHLSLGIYLKGSEKGWIPLSVERG